MSTSLCNLAKRNKTGSFFLPVPGHRRYATVPVPCTAPSSALFLAVLNSSMLFSVPVTPLLDCSWGFLYFCVFFLSLCLSCYKLRFDRRGRVVFFLKPQLSINFGKDFKRDTIELIARGPPGGYVYATAIDHEFYQRGAPSFPTEQQVKTTTTTLSRQHSSPYRHQSYSVQGPHVPCPEKGNLW